MLNRIAVLLALFLLAGACSSNDEEPQTVEKSVRDLRPGDCFNGSPTAPQNAKQGEETVLVVAALPCGESHEKEVFAVFEHPAKSDALFPGEKAVAKVAQDGCAERFADYVGRPFGDSDLRVAVVAPGLAHWDQKDRTIVCTLQGDPFLKGSKKAGAG